MRILLTGRNGQVGWELERALPALGEVIATDRSTLDLADADAIRRAVREAKPQVIVNAAAYTAVDRAELESNLAMKVNAQAPGVLAEEARRLSALLVHYSTDYVFDGSKGSPYVEDDATNPLSVYGKTKLAGELAVRSAGARYLILRTSWVYADRGKNFLLTMLQRASTGMPLRVVDDQIGAPTCAADVAAITVLGLRRPQTPEGTYHATAAGETTWCGFAKEIMRLARTGAGVQAIATADYPTAAKRPSYSVLDSSLLPHVAGVNPIGHWQERLGALMAKRAH